MVKKGQNNEDSIERRGSTAKRAAAGRRSERREDRPASAVAVAEQGETAVRNNERKKREQPEWAAHEHNVRFPAFEGFIELDLELRLLGHLVNRKLRALYTYTPDWQYFDLHVKRLISGREGSAVGFEVLAALELEASSSKDSNRITKRARKIGWKKVNLAEEGVLPEAVWDGIYRTIDEHCRAEDVERRCKYLCAP